MNDRHPNLLRAIQALGLEPTPDTLLILEEAVTRDQNHPIRPPLSRSYRTPTTASPYAPPSGTFDLAHLIPCGVTP